MVLLDVGPEMGDLTAAVRHAVSTFVTGKMVHKPNFEAQLFYFGTTGTSNALHQEMMEAEDDIEQYVHITEVKQLQPPDVGWLKILQQHEQGQPGTAADWFDALTVGVDAMYRSWAEDERPELLKKTVQKRIILVSNFLGECQPVDEAFMSAIIEKINQVDAKLQVMSLDMQCLDAAAHVQKNANTDVLAKLLQQIRHSVHRITDSAEAAAMLRTKEVGSTASFTGALEIGSQMKIFVKMSKKVSQERLPSTSKYSDKAFGNPEASHAVQPDREYKLERDPDIIIEADERVKGHQYGSQTVVIPDETMKMLSFRAEKGLKLMGFLRMDDATIRRHHYMKEVWALVAAKDDERSCLALSALVQALLNHPDQAAVVRVVIRDNQSVQVCAARPLPAIPGHAPCLLLNSLPFQEDMRQFPFPSFADSKYAPNREQLRVARDLVSSLDLTSSFPEQLRPETTANPLLHRFFDFVAARSLDAESPLPPPGPGAARLRHRAPAEAEKTAAVTAALAALPSIYPIREKEGGHVKGGNDGNDLGPRGLLGSAAEAPVGFDPAAATDAGAALRQVGTATPETDFKALLSSSHPEVAFSSAPVAVSSILGSPNEGLHKKAVATLQAMRSAAALPLHWSHAPDFNSFLRSLVSDAASRKQHTKFWMQAAAARLTMLTEQEAPGSGVSATEAAKFLADYDPSRTTPDDSSVPTVKVEEEENFDDME